VDDDSKRNLGPQFHKAGRTTYRIEKNPLTYRSVTATPVGKDRPVGNLIWSDNTPRGSEVAHVYVKTAHRRRGLASAMLDHAREHQPELKHSPALTPDGKVWAANKK
jgi:GNAT superfamily N-acetyltransferase